MRAREKEAGLPPDWEIDAFMAADSVNGKREAIATEYILRILGLDVRCCSVGLSCMTNSAKQSHDMHLMLLVPCVCHLLVM